MERACCILSNKRTTSTRSLTARTSEVQGGCLVGIASGLKLQIAVPALPMHRFVAEHVPGVLSFTRTEKPTAQASSSLFNDPNQERGTECKEASEQDSNENVALHYRRPWGASSMDLARADIVQPLGAP